MSDSDDVHAIIPVDAKGNGPVSGDEPIDALVCWCGDPECKYLAARKQTLLP